MLRWRNRRRVRISWVANGEDGSALNLVNNLDRDRLSIGACSVKKRFVSAWPRPPAGTYWRQQKRLCASPCCNHLLCLSDHPVILGLRTERPRESVPLVTMRPVEDDRFDACVVGPRHVVRGCQRTVTVPCQNDRLSAARCQEVNHVLMIHGGRLK